MNKTPEWFMWMQRLYNENGIECCIVGNPPNFNYFDFYSLILLYKNIKPDINNLLFDRSNKSNLLENKMSLV